MGSKSASARWSTFIRRARSRRSSYSLCSSLPRTWCGPADSSASVTALIDISAGSSVPAIHLRRIRMLVSSSPLSGRSLVIWVRRPLLQRGLLVGPERVEIHGGGAARHRGELLPRDEPPSPAQRDQLADAMAVPRARERLPPLDGVHDLP